MILANSSYTINAAKAVAKLIELQKGRFFQAITERPIEMLHGPTLVKRTIVPVQSGGDYTDRVNARRIKEGNASPFQSASLPWGKYSDVGEKIIEHKGHYYVRVYAVGPAKVEFVNPESGNVYDFNEVKHLLPSKEKRDREKMVESLRENQGVEKPVVPLTLRVDRLRIESLVA